MKIFSIPGKMEVNWLEDVKSILDVWTTYAVTLDEFKEAVYEKGMAHAVKNGGRAWIVDSTNAVGVFSNEIQNFIGTEGFVLFAQNGIKYFITITSKKSALTEMNIRKYSEQAGPAGVTLVEVENVEEAIDYLKQKN